MIRAVVLDVDGVIVGDKEGFNFPYPHKEVIEALKKIRKSGIFVSLCTGKAEFGIEKIIRDACLNNIHITDGGARMIDPIDKRISFQHTIDSESILPFINFYLRNNVYMELYTSSEYFALRRQISDFTDLHSAVLQRTPVLIDDVDIFLKEKQIVKIFLMARDDAKKDFISRSFAEKFGDKLALGWTINPNTMPWQLGLATAKGISKRRGVEDISKHLNVPLDNILGIGDTMHDWEFIEICGYGATLANACDELKELILRKGDRGYIGKSVNENGVMDIFKYFGLL